MALSSPEAKRATKSEDAASSAAQLQHANSTEESETNPTAMHGFKLFAVFIGICVGAFLMSLDIFVIATVRLPLFQKEKVYDTWIGNPIHHWILPGFRGQVDENQ